MSVYINAVGSFLPGEPIGNDQVADFLGPLDRRQSLIRRKALKQNGIRFRHYAIDRQGRAQYDNAGMAANACRAALERCEHDAADVDYLSAAASQGDLMAPGFASMVHGELGLPPLEIASFNSFCASGMMAVGAAHNAIAGGGRNKAIACASEFASRFLRSGYFEGSSPSVETEFLRWGLSDGAGAMVLENRPNERGLSLKIEFLDLVSYADRFDPCMFGGAAKREDGRLGPAWSNYPTLQAAVRDGAFHLRQDFDLLQNITPLGLSRYCELVNAGRIDPESLDWMLCHFSSDVFRTHIAETVERMGAPFDCARMFTNLHDKGNTGSASLFIMLDELFNTGRAQPGQKILCIVPESGRFVVATMLLEVVSEGETGADIPDSASNLPAGSVNTRTFASQAGGANPVTQDLLQRLANTWMDFETSLNRVPIIDRMNRGKLRLDDYRMLLRNLRQQVVEGARWISRAASNITGPALDLRTVFIGHAQDEHRDYRMLEKNYVAVGGRLEDIADGDKNIGSEALSAWMFHRASRENPLDLLGAMFIIEGIGGRLAGRWAASIQNQLGLTADQVSFLAYHADNDSSHLDKLWEVLDEGFLTRDLVDAIVKTAKVTARLYRLQLEEMDVT